MDVWMDGIVFGESPRWHDGRLWFSDWAAGRVWSVGEGREPVVEAEVESLMCIDFLPDGRLLACLAGGRRTAAASRGGRDPDRARRPVDRGGHRVERHRLRRPRPGLRQQHRVRLPAGRVRAGPGGPGGRRRLGARGRRGPGLPQRHGHQPGRCDPRGRGVLRREAHGVRHRRRRHPRPRRVWAATPGDHPDGICFDASGALWYADVANQHCVRVREGGEVLDTVDSDRGAFACALSREGDPLLLVVGQEWGPDTWGSGAATGQLVAFDAPSTATAGPSAVLDGQTCELGGRNFTRSTPVHRPQPTTQTRMTSRPSQVARSSISASTASVIAVVNGSSSCTASTRSTPLSRSAVASSLPTSRSPYSTGSA